VSIFCSSQDILFISFSDGVTIVGRKDAPSTGTLNGFKISVADDSSFNQSNCKVVWQKFGDVMCGFKEILPVTQSRR
jgi:hypothetical protein